MMGWDFVVILPYFNRSSGSWGFFNAKTQRARRIFDWGIWIADLGHHHEDHPVHKGLLG